MLRVWLLLTIFRMSSRFVQWQYEPSTIVRWWYSDIQGTLSNIRHATLYYRTLTIPKSQPRAFECNNKSIWVDLCQLVCPHPETQDNSLHLASFRLRTVTTFLTIRQTTWHSSHATSFAISWLRLECCSCSCFLRSGEIRQKSDDLWNPTYLCYICSKEPAFRHSLEDLWLQ